MARKTSLLLLYKINYFTYTDLSPKKEYEPTKEKKNAGSTTVYRQKK